MKASVGHYWPNLQRYLDWADMASNESEEDDRLECISNEADYPTHLEAGEDLYNSADHCQDGDESNEMVRRVAALTWIQAAWLAQPLILTWK